MSGRLKVILTEATEGGATENHLEGFLSEWDRRKLWHFPVEIGSLNMLITEPTICWHEILSFKACAKIDTLIISVKEPCVGKMLFITHSWQKEITTKWNIGGYPNYKCRCNIYKCYILVLLFCSFYFPSYLNFLFYDNQKFERMCQRIGYVWKRLPFTSYTCRTLYSEMIVIPFEESNGILLAKSHDHFKGVKNNALDRFDQGVIIWIIFIESNFYIKKNDIIKSFLIFLIF